MDLYRYFHPHHNPRLRNVPLRLQELGELEQAAVELHKALKRAEVRTGEAATGPIKKEHFNQIRVAMDYVVESLGTLSGAHPGDESDTMEQMLDERKDAPGWENWARLLKQRLEIVNQYKPESSGGSPFESAAAPFESKEGESKESDESNEIEGRDNSETEQMPISKTSSP